MSWRDRPYSDEFAERELRLQLRRPSTAVTWLIVANVAVYFVDVLSQRFDPFFFSRSFGLSMSGIHSLYLWQPLTYMFMHGGVLHLLFNMLGLYIFGSEFERSFGRHRFLQFYATCGVVGGLAYLGLAVVSPAYSGIPLVGASGAVYGLLIAAIVFFPHIQIVLIIFPMPVRVFGLIVVAILLLQLLAGEVGNPGGEVCHVAGALTGLGIFYAWGIMPRIRFGAGGREVSIPASPLGGVRQRLQSGAWARRQKKLAEEDAMVDGILEKVHREGIASLTRKERRILSQATERQREREKAAGRIDRL